MSQPVAQPYTSPYHEFCREQRPLLPPLTNSDREKKIGQMWKELSEAGRAVYKQGLTQLASSGRGGLRAWAHPAPPEFGACGVLPSANRPALPTKLPAPPSAAGSAKFLAGCEVAQSIAIPVRASVAQLGGTYQTFVTQGGFRKPPMVLAQSTSSKAALERLDATLPVQERATFWAAPERAAKTSPPSAAEDQPAAKRRACEENQGNSKPYLYDAQLWSNRAACALLIRNRQYAHSAPPASVPAPLPAVEQAVAQQIGEEGAVGGGASEGELERGRHAPEGGYSDGELDRILQEQLARLRSSWSHERC